MDLAQLISDFIEKNGLAAFAFVAITILYWRSQSHQKERDKAQSEIEKARVKAEKDARKEENLLQSNILNMYNRFDSTLSTLNNTLQTAFTTTNEVSIKVVTALEAQTAKLVDLEIVMIDHTNKSPTNEDLIKAIEELGKKIDNVDTNVKQIKEEFDVLKTQAETVKKATQEIPAIPPQAASKTTAQRPVTKVKDAQEIKDKTDEKSDNSI